MDAPQSAFLPLPTPEEVEAIRESRGYSPHPCRRRVESPPPNSPPRETKTNDPNTPTRGTGKSRGCYLCGSTLHWKRDCPRRFRPYPIQAPHAQRRPPHTNPAINPPNNPETPQPHGRRPLVVGPPTQGNARHTQETQPPLMPVQPTGTMVGMGLLNCGAGSGGSGLEAGLLAWLERAKPKAATIVQLGF